MIPDPAIPISKVSNDSSRVDPSDLVDIFTSWFQRVIDLQQIVDAVAIAGVIRSDPQTMTIKLDRKTVTLARQFATWPEMDA